MVIPSFLDLFSAHLLPDKPGLKARPLGLQQGFSVDTPKKVQQRGDQSGPARLVAGPEPRVVVTVARFTGL